MGQMRPLRKATPLFPPMDPALAERLHEMQEAAEVEAEAARIAAGAPSAEADTISAARA